jgi:DNA-binding phage protein
MAQKSEVTFDREIVKAEENLLIDFQFLLQGLLDKHNMSRADLARKTGLSKARLSQIFSSEANPTVKTLARVFHALGENLRLEVQEIDSSDVLEREITAVIATVPAGQWKVESESTLHEGEMRRGRSSKAQVAGLLREAIGASNDNYQQALTVESDAKSFKLKAA